MAKPPKPFTPPDCDLRGLPFMPLHGERLIDSDLFFMTSGDEFKAALALWWASWKQVPAASLPTNPRVLAGLARVGDMEKWERVGEMALHGWVLCSDGRLYHRVVADLALIAWEERQEHQAGKEAETERKRRERQERKQLFAQLRTAGIHLPWNIPMAQLRERAEQVGPAPVLNLSAGQVPDRPTPVTAKEGIGTGRGTLRRPPNPPGRGDEVPEGFEEGWGAFPAEGRATRGRRRAVGAWPQAVQGAGSVERLLCAIRAFAGGPYIAAGRPCPAFHNWLINAGYEAQLDKQLAVAKWTGPAKILDIVAEAMSDRALAQSYLAVCGWQEDGQTILAPRKFTADQIEVSAGRKLAEDGVRIVVGLSEVR